ncbi:MAG: response regulator transcription factor [Candidatus Kapabacteria bacterium]|nr:response regulator transcription factor [Candidatus Kapabacteria bacterium]
MKSALIVEDEVTLAEHLRGLLRTLDCESVVVHDGVEADEISKRQTFDIVLLDLQLPSLGGTELCKRIRDRDANVPIIILTAFSDLDTKMMTFDYGADDFISKPFHGRELLAKVNVFLKRSHRQLDTATIYRVADVVIDLATKIVTRGEQRVNLTPKEFGLLAVLAEQPGRIVSKTEIARRVWDVGFDTGTNTIEVYISLLRNKIDKPFPTRLIHTRPGFGYCISEKEP